MKRGKAAKEVIILSCVTATERDDGDEASAIVISTDRENYIVENNRLGRKPLALEDRFFLFSYNVFLLAAT